MAFSLTDNDKGASGADKSALAEALDAADYQDTRPLASDAPSVSAIIVTYYTGPLLWRSIHAVLQQDAIKEVVVVDNGNWPGTVANLVDMAVFEPRLKVITGQGNIGFAAGCNLGVSNAEGNEVFILNPDAIVPTGGIDALRQAGFDTGRDGPWVIGGRLVNSDGTEQAGARRATLTPWTALVEMLRLDKLAPRHPYFRRFNYHTEARPEETIATPVISGACMLMPKADYLSIGGMDEGYFLHAEDIDFCLRFAEAGGEVLFNPNVDVIHMKSSSRTDRVKVERWKAQSLNRYFRRHFSTQYPFGFVSAVCGLVWVGWSIRAVKTYISRAVTVLGFNRRHGIGVTARALRTARRMRDK